MTGDLFVGALALGYLIVAAALALKEHRRATLEMEEEDEMLEDGE